MLIPVQKVASAAKNKHAFPHSSGVPKRPSSYNRKKRQITYSKVWNTYGIKTVKVLTH